MERYRVIYNPKAGNGQGEEGAHRLDGIWKDKTLIYEDITRISDLTAYLDALPDDEGVILAGGDGTVNCFVNALGGREPKREILYLATGTGNDFLRDLDKAQDEPPFVINEYIRDLPTVRVNGRESYFFNGIGYGIDGYCCEVADRIRATSDKPVNYTSIAIKGLLYGYHRTRATVTVDGQTREYAEVWLAPTMNGRFFGGGMMAAPSQNRLNPERTVSLMVMHCRSKLKTLSVFPSIFKGGHVKHTDMVESFRGHEITVRFDRPTALQIDGETVLGVTEYSVQTAAARRAAEKATKAASLAG